ncbi:hypothetical protein ROZALSC1DRAFT_27990, partial [Rozella allomycis CSF55]
AGSDNNQCAKNSSQQIRKAMSCVSTTKLTFNASNAIPTNVATSETAAKDDEKSTKISPKDHAVYDFAIY